jgi:3-phosphoshikimate 1-carboxyvinyltransferase
VAAAIHPEAEVRIADVNLNPTRTALLDVLREMGAHISETVTENRAGEPAGEVVVRGPRQLRAIHIGSDQVPALIDELPLIAVAMAAADGTGEVSGAKELRVKESDRISAIGSALTAAGANFEEVEDGWRISRGIPRDARVITFNDHRIAMAMAVAAWTGVARTVELDDPACVAISYPTFWDDARQIGAIS